MSHHPRVEKMRITRSNERLRHDDPAAEAAARRSHRAAIMLQEKRRELYLAVGMPWFDRVNAEFVAARQRALEIAMICVQEFERSVRERMEEVCMAPPGPSRDRANAALALARFGLSFAIDQVRVAKGECSPEELRAFSQLHPGGMVIFVPKSGGGDRIEEKN